MLRPSDEAKLLKLKERQAELEALLSDEKVLSDPKQRGKLAKEHSYVSGILDVFASYQKVLSHVKESQEIIRGKGDADFKELAQSELLDLEPQLQSLTQQLSDCLDPSQNEPDKDIIIEIRAGTGGQEASLFASDLYRMYTRYADLKGWTLELMSYADTEAGGVKEVVFSLGGKECSKRLKWESGIHRVQRVPATEASGRIHTSAVTVAILFEPEEIELELNPKDLKIDVYRSSGPGGQGVNTTDSAVRITHLPTGTVVVCQDERSQLKNRHKAMRILRARILDNMQQQASQKETALRRSQVGSGDRSEKIRTYNFPDRRVTDHRIGFTSHQLESILNGDMEELTTALMAAEKEAKEKAGAT